MSEEKLERKHPFLKRVIITLLIIAGICSYGYFGCKIKHVEIKENRLYEEEKIKQLVLNDKYSWNALYVYFKYKFTKVDKLPFIDTVEVKLTSPNSLTFTVYEKGMLGYIYQEKNCKNIYFDKDGVVIESSVKVIPDVPNIIGLSCEKIKTMEKLQFKHKKSLDDLLSITKIMKKYEFAPNTITFLETGNIVLDFGDIKVNLGKPVKLTEKVTRLQKIYPMLEGKKGVLRLDAWSEETRDIPFEMEEG